MLRAIGRFWRKAYDDNLTGMAAMVAYNLLLSVFPLALVALFVAGRVLSSEDVEASVVDDLQRLFPAAADSTLIDGLRRVRDSSTTVGIVAVVAATWFSSSFWGALDTAFCRIYHRECRSWVRQKLFALGMLLVVLVFFVASVAIPALQGVVVNGAGDLPFGLGEVRGLVYSLTLAGGLVLIFAILCLVYWRVPRGAIPWRCIWPGALGAMAAMGVVDYGFPLYLSNVTSLRIGTSFVFVLIVLVWFYALALILLAGAVVNELRYEGRARSPGALSEFPASARMPVMEQRISLITLGVADLRRAMDFYAAMGWEGRSPDGDVAFFQAGGMVFGLWSRAKLAEDSGVEDAGGWGGMTLAHNVRSPAEVDAVLEQAAGAGGTVARPGAETPWGGYSGAFHDPDGHAWEIAHNPGWTLTEDGSVRL